MLLAYFADNDKEISPKVGSFRLALRPNQILKTDMLAISGNTKLKADVMTGLERYL